MKKTLINSSMYEYRCKITRVVDGDTVKCDIDLGFGIWQHNETVRLLGIDTPESRTSDKDEKPYGLLSKKKLTEQIEKAEVIKIVTTRDEKGKFGRILGTLVADGGDNINAYMIRHNYAVNYQGQNKEDVQQEHLKNRVILNERGEMNNNKE